MKRFFALLLLTLTLSSVAEAQQHPTERMKVIHMAAVRIAERIGVQASSREAFVSMYQAFKKESAVILADKPAPTGKAEEDAEAKIYSDFAKSEKLLALRKNYYARFRTLLSPSQIQAMYDLEKESAARK